MRRYGEVDRVVSAIFVSYRRGPVTVNVVQRLRDALDKRYEAGSTFCDITGILPGAPFERVLHEVLQTCRAMVVVVDHRWVSDEGRHRLHEPNDWVRLKVEAALRRGIWIFPVLLDGTSIPKPNELPFSMAELCLRQVAEDQLEVPRRRRCPAVPRPGPGPRGSGP